MKYAIIEGGIVVNIALADAPLAENWIEATADAQIGGAYDGQFHPAPPPPPPTPEEIQAEIVVATQNRLDAFARTRHYDDIKSASDYAGCSVQRFAVEGAYCRDARAETWAALYDMLDEVQAGTRPMPTGFADIEAELPPLVWPA
jgi:hypothetical protein